jgi:hypothetical protein
MRQVGVCRRPVFNSSMSSVRNAHYPSTCRNPGSIPVANPAEDWLRCSKVRPGAACGLNGACNIPGEPVLKVGWRGRLPSEWGRVRLWVLWEAGVLLRSNRERRAAQEPFGRFAQIKRTSSMTEKRCSTCSGFET